MLPNFYTSRLDRQQCDFFFQLDTLCWFTNLRISNPFSLLWKIATREAEWSFTYVLSLYFASMCNINGWCIFQNKAKDDDLPNFTLVYFDKISSTWMHYHQSRFYTNTPSLLLSDNKETLWKERKVATRVFVSSLNIIFYFFYKTQYNSSLHYLFQFHFMYSGLLFYCHQKNLWQLHKFFAIVTPYDSMVELLTFTN